MEIIKSNRSITMEKTDEYVKKIKPEEDAIIETINAFGDRFENLSELEYLMSMENPPHHHPLTGPIYVEGAMPGDFLKVQIENIELFDMAQMLSKSAGIAPLEKDENFDFSSRYPIFAQAENKTRKLQYIKNQMNLEVAPCVGMIATMPKKGIIKTGHIGVTGGNFDNPFITEGTSIYLPVQVEGAGLYLGDVHAKQAYGELSGIALEASSNVKIKVSILKPWIPFESNPIFIMGKEPLTKQNALAVIGIGKSFKNGDEAVRDSFFKTIEVIKRLKPTLSEMMIRSLLSLIGNSMAGQAYSNTSESTSQILLTEDQIRSIYFTENENILDDIELCLFKSSKDIKSKSKTLITIGAVKGRLQKVLHKYIESLGIEIPKINPRLLVYDIETPNYILRINLLKWKDISKNYTKFDLVIYGADKWLENSNKAFVALKHFEQNDCRMSILVPNELKDYPLSYFLKRNIATTYPNILKQNYDIKDSNIVEMEGSVEASIKLGWADSIFDVVETGETAKVNGLVEHTEVVKFGAVLATARIDKLPLFVNLGLIEPINNKISVAFDGIDGSGKSTLAKNVVQTGLFRNSQVVLVEPFSGKVGKDSFALWKANKFLLWAEIVGKQHWSARNVVNTVYDRSLLTALVDNLEQGKEDIALKVIKAWEPLPNILFYCKLPAQIAYERNMQRAEHDEFESLESLQHYEKKYEEAVQFIKEHTNIKVVEIDASKSTHETIKKVKEILQYEKFD